VVSSLRGLLLGNVMRVAIGGVDMLGDRNRKMNHDGTRPACMPVFGGDVCYRCNT
jgi:hypothetical protein